jgi:hypothetical protein
MHFRKGRFLRPRVVLLLGGLAVVITAAVVLGVQQLESPGSGISRSNAIQLAWQRSGTGALTVRSAEITRNFQTGFDQPTHRWAWVVTFNGQWHLLCSGHTTDGSCDPTSQWVAIDYYTGQWIASQFSYPAAP